MASSDKFANFRISTTEKNREEDEQDRLLLLFANRANLKKEFAGLREERYHLLDKLKQQEGATQRAKDQMTELEALLADPIAGFNAVVFYQLRNIWMTCHDEMGLFAAELKKQQEDRERKKQVMQFNQKRESRLRKLNQKIAELKAQGEEIAGHISSFMQRKAELKAFWNFFKRRKVDVQLNRLNHQREKLREKISQLFDMRMKIESEAWPEFPGITLDGKRTINIAIIAMAQHLFDYFSGNSHSALAKASMIKQPQDLKFGDRRTCVSMMDKIKSQVDNLKSNREFATDIKRRTDHLRTTVRYRREEDVIPVAESVGTMTLGLKDKEFMDTLTDMSKDPNVLADEYWDIYKILLK